ncbi:MAG: motility associated factor glycosyltransferase family protein [Alkaliphilus sp.]
MDQEVLNPKNYYSKNTEKMNQSVLKELEKVKTFTRGQVIECKKTGCVTVKLKDLQGGEILIHSKYDPQKEADRVVQGYSLESHKEIILVGFGCGYLVEAVLQKLDDSQKLIVIVVNIDVFKTMLKRRDLRQMLGDRRLKLIVDRRSTQLVNDIAKYLGKIDRGKTKMIMHNPSIKTMSDDLIKLRDILERIDVNRKSHKIQKDKVRSNAKENMDIVIESDGIKEYRGKYSNKPIFIIAAGPSLDMNIDELKRIGQKGIIIAVGTAVKPLVNKGIRPNYIVSIDAYDAIYDQLEGSLNLRAPLLFIPSVNAKMLRAYKGEKIVAFPDKDPSSIKLEASQNKGFIKTGGSVATTALDFANQLGGNPLIFVGQDLAISDKGQTHAKTTARGEDRYSIKNLRTVDGVNGKKVYTLTNLYMYLRWFESYIKEYPKIKFIDATEGGAKIASTEIMKLKDVIDKYCIVL